MKFRATIFKSHLRFKVKVSIVYYEKWYRHLLLTLCLILICSWGLGQSSKIASTQSHRWNNCVGKAFYHFRSVSNCEAIFLLWFTTLSKFKFDNSALYVARLTDAKKETDLHPVIFYVFFFEDVKSCSLNFNFGIALYETKHSRQSKIEDVALRNGLLSLFKWNRNKNNSSSFMQVSTCENVIAWFKNFPFCISRILLL